MREGENAGECEHGHKCECKSADDGVSKGEGEREGHGQGQTTAHHLGGVDESLMMVVVYIKAVARVRQMPT